jgi:sarcosine oxidase subunit gamma
VTAEAPVGLDAVEVNLAQVDVRADPAQVPFEAPDPNTVTTWMGREVLWLRSDEWLLVSEPGTEEAIVDELRAALAGVHHSVIDVSANRTIFDLTGALDLLSTGCGLDLDPSRWRPGMCAQTLFGGAQVILHRLDERTTRVFVRPSFADHVVSRLLAARPFTG